MTIRTQRGYRICDTGKEKREDKRQRRNSAGRWAVSKSNDLVDTKESGSKDDSKGGKKMYLLSMNNIYRP